MTSYPRAAFIVACITIAGAVFTGAAQVRRPAGPGQESNPQRDRLARAIEQGEVDVVRTYLDAGGNVNDAWRDNPRQIVRSLLARSIWGGPQPAAGGREQIFFLLIERGADPRSVPLQVPVRDGKLEIVRTLIARGVRPAQNEPVLLAALESKNAAMVDLVLSSRIGVSIDPSELPVHFLTDDITRLLVPKYLTANARTPIGNEACDVLDIFGFNKHEDGCEGAVGPLWLHFVVTGNRKMVAYLIEHGADLRLHGEVPAGGTPFTAMEIATARKDKPMMQLLTSAAPTRR